LPTVVHCRAANISAFISRTAAAGQNSARPTIAADVQLDDLADGDTAALW
jgi:hypothetical protein